MISSYFDIAGYPNETAVRLGFFLLIFIAVAMAEIGAPRRRLSAGKAGRWWVNLSLTLLDAVLVRLSVSHFPCGSCPALCRPRLGGVEPTFTAFLANGSLRDPDP